MTIVSVNEAQRDFKAILARIAAGEDIRIRDEAVEYRIESHPRSQAAPDHAGRTENQPSSIPLDAPEEDLLATVRRLRKQVHLGPGETIRSLIDEGRRI
jgi:hypothetical protein